jgi:hypothetical protein
MPTPPLTFTPEQDLFWADAVRALDEGETTREQIMAVAGISERTLKRRLARGREVLGDIEEHDDGEHDTSDFPWVPIVDGAAAPGLHYRLDADKTSVLPSCPFRIGTGNGRHLRVHHSGDGRPVEKPKPSKAKHKPKIDGKRRG